MPPVRRMEDHIRDLCKKLAEADGSEEEFRTLAVELRSSLSKHIAALREKVKTYPLTKERRSGNQ